MAAPQTRKLWLAIAILIVAVIIGFVWKRPKVPSAPVAIEDGKTIDFSTGEPVMKGSAEDQAAIEKAQREMEEATEEITFSPKAQP